LDTIGFFARSISDIQLISRVFNIIEPTASPSLSPKSISECSFGFVKTDQWNSLASDDLKTVWAKAQDLLTKSGAQVEEVDLGPQFENLAGPNGRIAELTEAEAQTNILREYRIGKDKLDPQVISWAENGRGTTRQRLVQVQDEIATLRPKMDEIAGKYSVLITPSVPGEAPEGLEWTGSPHFCSLWTALHTPAINVPGFAGSKGLPIGLTLVAPRYVLYMSWANDRYQDEKLLHVAKLVASVFVGSDGGKLKHPPAPTDAVYVEA
jgi:amidase